MASSHRLPSRRIPQSQLSRRLHLVDRRRYHARSFLGRVSGIHGLLRRVFGRGIYSRVFTLPSEGEFTFLMQPFFAPNKTLEETETLPEPCSSICDSWRSPSRPRRGTLTVSTTRGTLPSRWKRSRRRRTNWEDPVRLNETFDAIKPWSNTGLTLIAFNTAPMLARGGSADNARNPTQPVPMLQSRKSLPVQSHARQPRSRVVSGGERSHGTGFSAVVPGC